MTELTYEVPTIGEKHQASDARVSTALTEIKSVLNGRLTAGNFAKETITAKKFAKSEKWTSTTFGKAVGKEETFEVAATGQNRSVGLTLIVEEGIAVGESLTIKVGGNTIAKVKQPGGFLKKATVDVGPIRVPAGEALTLEMPASGIISKESVVATQANVA